MTWNVLVVEDEPITREDIAYIIEQLPYHIIVYQAEDGIQALQFLHGMQADQASSNVPATDPKLDEKRRRVRVPDVIFLDIQLPDMSGIQLAELINSWQTSLGIPDEVRSKIVFCTAYDQYAVQAFKLRAFHYLLKPYVEKDIAYIFHELDRLTGARGLKKEHVQPASISVAMNRGDLDESETAPFTSETSVTSVTPINSITSGTPATTGMSSIPTSPHKTPVSGMKLAVTNGQTVQYISPEQIVYLMKEEKHVTVKAQQATYSTPDTLQRLEQKLTSYAFFRCHKSYVINLQQADMLSSYTNGTYNLRMMDGSIVPVSRNYVKQLRSRLEL